MSKIIELSRPVKPAPTKHVCRWIVTIEGQRARVPATFRQFLGLVPAILGGSGAEKEARS